MLSLCGSSPQLPPAPSRHLYAAVLQSRVCQEQWGARPVLWRLRVSRKLPRVLAPLLSRLWNQGPTSLGTASSFLTCEQDPLVIASNEQPPSAGAHLCVASFLEQFQALRAARTCTYRLGFLSAAMRPPAWPIYSQASARQKQKGGLPRPLPAASALMIWLASLLSVHLLRVPVKK